MKPRQSERVFAVNFIAGGVFYTAGQPIPEDEIKPFMLTYEVKPNAKNAERGPRQKNLRFDLNRRYGVDSKGYRFGDVERQVSEMLTVEQERELIEQSLNEPPNETVAAAMELAQADHAADVAGQKAELAARARRHDEAEEWALAEQAKTRDRLDVDGFSAPTDPADDIIQDEFVSPNAAELPQQEEMPAKPKPRMRKRYVRRGNTWLRAMKVSCRAGEAVYVREGKGRFSKVGVVGKGGSLPAAYVEE